jgi:DNA-binding Lrp family transcriptional regulator
VVHLYVNRNPLERANRLRAYIAGQDMLRGQMTAFRDMTGVDPMDAIIAGSVAMSAVSHLDAPEGDGGHYASFDTAPPPCLLKSITVSALARSLGLPRETVRRRAAGLAAAGWLEQSSRGLTSVPAFLDATGHQKFLEQVNQAGVALLRGLGYPERRPGTDDGVWVDVEAIQVRDRLFSRLCLQFGLRLYEAAVRLTGNLERSLVLITVISMTLDPGGQAVSDSPRIKASVSRRALAAELDIHPETLRRLLIRLERDGLLTRSADGFRPSAALLTGEALARSVEQTVVQIRNLVRILARAGFLAEPNPDAGVA